MQGGSNRYRTGSGINMDSFSLMTGLTGSYKATPETDITLGAFVETGTGSFHANNRFTGLASVKSRGHTDYIGAGIMGHIESASGFHGDAALRAGRVKSDMNTDFYFGGKQGKYDDTSSLYLGAHLGGGYQLGITSTVRLAANFVHRRCE